MMMSKKYTLTISILASNRKDTLPKTLASIKPILDNVSSELIVVDTGCDEELLGLIRQYTDNIVRFQWVKDFSKARNAGLEKAQGEWFLYIDDDEWFEDVSEIIDFFNSEEKDKYGYGKYYQRNYHDMEGSSWSDFAAGRAFRLNEGTKFVDAIHERPINIDGPTKYFDVYAHHYGYVYKTEEEKRAHIERNMSLLKEQLKSQPDVARHYGHLIQEYCSTKEYDKIIETAKLGIEKADMSTMDNRKNVPGLYAAVGWALLNQGKYNEVLHEAEVYLDSPYCNKLCEATWSAFCATAARSVDRYEECVSYVARYFTLREYLMQHEEECHAMSAAIIIYGIEEANCRRVATAGLVAASHIGEIEVYKLCLQYMEQTAALDNAGEKDFVAMLLMAEKCGMDIATWLERKALAWWMNILDKWSVNVKVKELVETKIVLSKMLSTNSIYMQYYDVVFTEAMLMRKKLEDVALYELQEEIQNYIETVLGFYKNMYQSEVFEKYTCLLPIRGQVALMLKELCEKQEVGVKVIEKIIKITPRFTKLVKKYEELMQNKLIKAKVDSKNVDI